MAPFRFRLARVLRVRQIEEDVAKAAWSSAIATANEADRRVEATRLARQTSQTELSQALAGSKLTPAEVLTRHRTLDALSADLERRLQQARTLHFQAEQMRVPWEAKRNEVRGLERLHDKHKQEFQAGERLTESRLMDEVASMRAAKRKKVDHS